MPIKFRCSYCRQFLGISRNRVGSVVDCPTCGRSIRVPGTDGVTAPVPPPELDRADSHLARALDELAALADAPLSRPAVETLDDFNEEAEIPQPLPEPEPVELPMPVLMAPMTTIEPVASTPAPTDEREARAVIEELLRGADTAVAPNFTPHVVEQKLPLRWLFIAAIIPVVSLLLGAAIGWWIANRPQPAPIVNAAAANVAEPAVALVTPELEGRITYQTANGEIRPDAGALVIAVSESWMGTLRLSPLGLRPGDGEADQTAALRMAAAFGGNAGRTDDEGRYRFAVPAAGQFAVVIISQFAERADAAEIPAETRSHLAKFLADPSATVGQRAVHSMDLTLPAGKSTALDHAF